MRREVVVVEVIFKVQRFGFLNFAPPASLLKFGTRKKSNFRTPKRRPSAPPLCSMSLSIWKIWFERHGEEPGG